MNKHWFLLLLVVLVVGCQPEVATVTGTPTATIPPLVGDPIPVELSALAANPTIYENAYIQLTGQYTHQPRLVCKSEPHPAPVTWGVRSDTLLALAGGFDKQLRPLLPPGLTMTIAGRWQHWQGNVGCGDSVQPQDMWYLHVTEIISPSPLTLVTLTPGGVPVAQVDETPISEGTPAAQLEPTEESINGETAVPPPSEPTTSSSQSTPDSEELVRATATTAVSDDPRATPTPTSQFNRNTATPDDIEPTATPTGNNGTTTPTPTPLAGTSGTASPTPTTAGLTTSTPSPTPKSKGEAELETLHMNFLDGNETHLWTFDNEVVNNNLTVQVVPAAPANITITIYDTNNNQIASENSTGTGIKEIISNLTLPTEGIYDIVINDNNGIGGDYAIVILDDFSFNITLHQTDYGAPQIASFTEDEEQIWFFDGNADDTITITANPTTGEPDIGFEFVGPFAEPLDYIDELFDSSDAEVLQDFTLDDDGLYGIWLFGFDSNPMSIELSVND
jgi:hypothetical protein